MINRVAVLACSLFALLPPACTYNPKVEPDRLRCRDENGCPSGYRCVGATGNSLGICCNKPDAAECLIPTDAATRSEVGSFPDSASRDLSAVDGSGQPELGDTAALDLAAGPEVSSDTPSFEAGAARPDAAADSPNPPTDVPIGPESGQPGIDSAKPDAAADSLNPPADVPTPPADVPIGSESGPTGIDSARKEVPITRDTPDATDASTGSPLDAPADSAGDMPPDGPVGIGPQIYSIEGTGASAPIAPRAEDVSFWNAHVSDRQAASNRISSTSPVLVVTGANLDSVTLATLKGQSGQGNHDMTIEEKTMTNLRLRWPSTLTAGGLFILSLTAALGTANAQVFFLQGEKGDQGDSEPGKVVLSAAYSLPTGWLLCDGSAVSRTTYAALFTAIGTTYGTGDGSTTSNLPNMTDRFPRGNTLGIGGGADTHSHAAGTLAGPNHTHTVPKDGWGINTGDRTQGRLASAYQAGGGDYWSAVAVANDNTSDAAGTGAVTGSTDTGSNVPAYTGLKFIIKT